MRLHFLGAARTVTGSQYLLETDRARVLVDCGMFQGSPHDVLRNRVPLAYEPATIDALLLTHAHLDHCGRIPALVKAGYNGPIHATPGTLDLKVDRELPRAYVLIDRVELVFAGKERNEKVTV